MKTCGFCGRDIPEPTPENSIVASGGWCAPSETIYDINPTPMCSRCLSAFLLGIHPDVLDAITTAPRGGITFTHGKKQP